MDELGVLKICVETLTPHVTILKMGYLRRLLELNEAISIEP